MNIDLITKQDLDAFKQELLNEIRDIVKPEPIKKWLTSSEVRKLLSISASSLQNLRISGDLQGNMYIDYYNEDIDPAIGDLSKIKKTDPFMLFNMRVSKNIDQYKFYIGIDNIFNYIQDEKYLDDAAFIYAPLYGTMIYGGISVNIQ